MGTLSSDRGWILSRRDRKSNLRYLSFEDDSPIEVNWKAAKKMPINFSDVWDGNGNVADSMKELLDLSDGNIKSINTMVTNLSEAYLTEEIKGSKKITDGEGNVWTHLKSDKMRELRIAMAAQKEIERELGEKSAVVIDLLRRYHPFVDPYREGLDHLVRFEVQDKQELAHVRSFDPSDPNEEFEESYTPSMMLYQRFSHLK